MTLKPVGLPDVQDIWVSDLHVVCLSVQEVKEVFDSEWSFVMLHPPDRLEQVLHKRMDGHLKKRTSQCHLCCPEYFTTANKYSAQIVKLLMLKQRRALSFIFSFNSFLSENSSSTAFNVLSKYKNIKVTPAAC